MEAAAGSVIDRVVGSMLTRITKELGYWFSSRKNVEAMNKGMERVKDAAKEIEKQMEENDVKNIPLPPHVSTWLEEVKNIKKEAERIPTDGIGVGCFNIKKRYKAGKQSFDILQNLTQLGDIPQFESAGEKVLARVHTKNQASTSSAPIDDSTIRNSFKTRDVIFEKALKCLEPKNSKTRMIALSGMGGVGKSHMMDRLKNHVEDSNMFKWVVKVVVGQNTGVIALQHALAEKTGGALTETTSDARADRLRNRLARMSKGGEKKILVILDDVWEVLDLKDLGLSSSPLPKGFKLLITSRYADVCIQMGVDTDSVFRIGALDDDEASVLFFETVGVSRGLDHDLDKIGEEIIKRCGNLPIALKTIASTLKSKTKKESAWKEAVFRLQHHDVTDHYEFVHNVFKISYDFLKTKDEKALFLLSGLFPDDFDIPVEELIRYGWGLKLFSKVSTLAKARLQVETCIDRLISANLLAESDRVGCVVMHDLARAFALSNSTEVNQTSIVNHDDILEKITEDANESYQRVMLTFTTISEFPRDFNCPNLTFLKLMGGVEQLNFPDRFYKNMEKLEVLSYEDVLYPPLLPTSSLCSTHLRALCLHGCELISDWSAIGELVNLEVLSFANSRIEKLPSVIGKLKKLRLLDLTGCLDLHIDNGVFRDLDKLEELYMRVSGQKAIQFTDANCDELEKLSMKLCALEVEFFDKKVQPKNMSFKNLERFKISIGCLLEVDKEVYSFQNTLKLVTNNNDLLECNINELFKKTEKLHLCVKEMIHLKDSLLHPPQESFSKLRVLVVEECADLRYLFTVAMANGLRKLEQLSVSRCGVMESVIHGDENENDEMIIFRELKVLKLCNLSNLRSLCDVDKVVELPQLMELVLRGLPKFTTIYPDSEMQLFFNKKVEDVSMHPSQDSFSKLRVLVIDGYKELRYLFTTAIATGLSKLERLKVYHCPVLESLVHGDESENGVIIFQELKFLSLYDLPKLGSLCDIDKVVELPQLVVLTLSTLPMLSSIYPCCEMQSFFNKQVAVPKLEQLHISFMKNLKQIWPSEVTSGEEFQISMVRGVSVESCHSLVNLFPINPMPMLCNLETLRVHWCDAVEVLFNIDLGRVGKFEEVSCNLRSIRVTNSKNLTQVWRIKGANKSQVSGFQAVENIYIHGCISFKEVFTPVTTNFHMRALLDTDMQDSSDSLFHKALKSLQQNNKATKIALCGMGSVGKTRMMKNLVDEVEGAGMFDLVLRLNIGREANPIALQQTIAEYIGEDLKEITKEARAKHLHKRCMQISQDGKKHILLILDDLWKVLDLEDIGLWSSPLPNGVKLLITSRDVNACSQMGVEKSSIFRLGVVDDAEAKTLFFETVGLPKDDYPDLYKIGEDITIRCGNFPISIKTIASVLKGNINDKSKWEEALSLLQNHELEDIYDVLKLAFEMSYNNLKADDKKAILLLCVFFPKDFDINVEELMRCAWGLNLFPKVTTLVQARHLITASVDLLIPANFLNTSDGAECVKVQPHAHDFILSNLADVKQASFDHGNTPEDANEFYERIFFNCKGMPEFPVALNYPNLKLLKLVGEEELVKFPQDFYDRMENLEVVAYERMVDPLLPSHSTNLRTLCLNSCSLTDDFTFLGNLINLEILSFARCGIKKLPSTIGKLRKLKLLDVTGCSSTIGKLRKLNRIQDETELTIDDGVFRNLVNLEELYMKAGRFRFTDANYEELETLLRQLCVFEFELYDNKLHPKDGSFEKLEKFKISLGCRFNEFEQYSKNTLKLESNCSEVVESRMNELFEKTVRLYLQVKDMKHLEDVSMHYSFCNLRELEVSDCTDLTFLFTVQVVSGLTKLETLKVSRCPVLETLIHGESVIRFPKLKFLYLEGLPRLKSLCNEKNRVELQQLVELSLFGLPNFTSIYSDDKMQSFFNAQVQIPKLEELRIYNMEKLMQIWPYVITTTGSEEENNNSSMLRVITVSRCDSLVNLFPCNPLPLLNHLERLYVENCCSIKGLFNMDLKGAGAGNINEITSSLRVIGVWNLENLREIWRIKGANNCSSGLHIRCFQAVKDISISNCKRFTDIFAPKNINFDIRADMTKQSI